MKSAWWITRA
jgi:Protein of unknown function (DUF1488)